jgi:rod shape-determining protein MreB
MEIKGRDLVTGGPKALVISQAEIADALVEPVSSIIGAVRQALEDVPPELAADIVDRGVILTGGVALLRNFDAVLRQATGLPVLVAENPLTCGVFGAGKALEEIQVLHRVLQG